MFEIIQSKVQYGVRFDFVAEKLKTIYHLNGSRTRATDSANRYLLSASVSFNLRSRRLSNLGHAV